MADVSRADCDWATAAAANEAVDATFGSEPSTTSCTMPVWPRSTWLPKSGGICNAAFALPASMAVTNSACDRAWVATSK